VRADSRKAVLVNETWKSECGACHVAYPPRLLPARTWQDMMRGLERHFGTDASVDAAVASEITAFLSRYAGRDRGVAPSLRITDTAWFARKHRDVPATAWTRPAIKSRANCGACHPGAERGDFDDDAVAIPR
jgi:hypothetical protein